MKQSKTISNLENRIAELEKEKDQLLKLVSHDVKSPFNKLFALCNLLQMVSENLNEEQLDYLTRMEWVIKEGLIVVRNLMDLRAIENKSIELMPEEFNLTSVVKDNFKNYTKQIKSKNLQLQFKISEVILWSDKRLIERITDHIVSNAIKFTPMENSINVKLANHTSNIKFSVSSKSGVLSSEEVDNLYKQSSPLSTRPTHGESALGNGLFIAQTLAHQIGGAIGFNQKNSTIEFTLTLPKKLEV